MDIETFVAAARTGSFAAAARQLGVSPAMVGRRIQGLEDAQGLRLIERTTRVQRLTEIGEAFLIRAEAVLEAVEELNELAAGVPGALAGRIRVSAPTALGTAWLTALAAEFSAEHPDVTVELSLSNRVVDLVAEGFDLAIRVGELRESSLVVRRVGTYRFAVCASPDWVARYGEPKHPDELSGLPCIPNLNMTPRNRWPFAGPGGGVTATIEGHLQIDNDQAQRVAVLKGVGAAYLPADVVADDIEAGRLVPLLSGWQTLTMPIHVVFPSRRLVPRRITVLVERIASRLRER